MFPTDQSHSYKAYPIADYESESTEISYTSLHKPNFSSKDSNTTPFTKESSLFAKESLSFVKEKQNPLYFSNIHKDSRRRNPFFTTKDEEDSEQGPSKRLCFENPYEYRAKTTSFVERRPEFTRENTWNVGNNTINFTNVNSLAHFQRKNTGINQKIQLFEHVKTEIPQEISFGKNARGLKNLSIKVREFVINHKETSYKEIAEQLLKEMKKGNHGIESAKEEQNIKRRIYDALNVLVATEIFKKRGKTVYYDGKSNVMGHDLMNKRVLVDKEALLAKIQQKKEIIASKQKTIQSMLIKNLAIKSLLHRNFVNAAKHQDSNEKFEFPFLLLSMNSTSLTLKMNKQKNKLGIFSKSPLNILGDMDVLIKLNLHKVEKKMIEKWFPRDVIHYLPEDFNDEAKE